MKRNLFVASFGALAMGALFSVSASAQTCANPVTWQPPVGGNTVSGTTCGQEPAGQDYCGGNFAGPGPAYVIKSDFAASRTFTTITVTQNAGFGGAVYMVKTTDGCGVNANCGPTGAPGAPITTTDVQDGSWYIIVTAANADAAGACGAFTLSTDGTFPVTLQNFTVS